MDQKWKIIYYKTASERSPVEEFIDNLSFKAQVKIADTFDLLKEFGINLGLPHVKKLTGTPLWELRILGQDSIRIFYVAQAGRIFLLLHGFIKKRQKTDKREIKTALKRLAEH
ncbi:MAG: type II toxin-antitoxin system RelE/ParE family toxin [Candidatus Levybacteria bacterium]|nr:type II toxin-antitoxin system RelE/ParE family toxin [Candidatus Levybacteria bacterium]